MQKGLGQAATVEATLKKAAKAAESVDDQTKARQYYQKIVAIADGADTSRTEVADARAYLNPFRSPLTRAFLLPIVLGALTTPVAANRFRLSDTQAISESGN
jgi:hypothetical protein